jgi:lipid-A-disaccharide synthase-like uncharacterized protein
MSLLNPWSLSVIPQSWLTHPPEGWYWFCLGIAGNLVFGSRFFIQWIYSEKHKESKVPIIFWWISVVGTLLLLAYFVRIRNIVGMLGNGPNLLPYTRNLMLIYRKRREHRAFPIIPV